MPHLMIYDDWRPIKIYKHMLGLVLMIGLDLGLVRIRVIFRVRVTTINTFYYNLIWDLQGKHILEKQHYIGIKFPRLSMPV